MSSHYNFDMKFIGLYKCDLKNRQYIFYLIIFTGGFGVQFLYTALSYSNVSIILK